MTLLDVLAVWHSFLLNPGDYLGYCKWNELQHLPLVPFPWAKVVSSLTFDSSVNDGSANTEFNLV